eukprot:6031563-Karenia_brevis.AAC.1
MRKFEGGEHEMLDSEESCDRKGATAIAGSFLAMDREGACRAQEENHLQISVCGSHGFPGHQRAMC